MDFASQFPGLRWPLRRRWMALALGLLVGAGVVPPSASAEPVFTNKGRFRIPYQLDADEIRRLGASEIQLHVSTDNGRTWRHVDSVPPVEGKFTFDATRDGEYSFAVRTVDRRGDVHPAGPLTASLQVTVDATAPLLDIEVEPSDVGRVQVRWDASDAHLDPQSLTLEHRDATTGGWEPFGIDATASGQTSWSLEDGGAVEVRGSVRDQAGNETTAQANTTIETIKTVTEPDVAPKVRRRRQPIATDDPKPSDELITDTSSLPEITPEVVAFSRTIPDHPTEEASVKETPHGHSPNGHTSNGEESGEHTSVAQPEAGEVSVAEPLAATTARPQEAAVPATTPLAEGSERWVSSTTFQIAYALDDVGPSGVSSVDLYLTENGGQKWFHYGVDEDRRSPLQITVPDDGTYGFAIRVKSGVGLAKIPPQPSDSPELTVTVDRQPPRATLLPVRQGEGTSSSRLLIEWKVTDEALPEQPVALSYAEQLSGPWMPLGGWRANTGRYDWVIGPDVPPQVYVRLDARDRAGNVSRAETDQPMIIDLSRPTARFLSVEPAR